MDIEEFVQLAEEFGLPCIVRGDILTLIGEVELIEINWRKNDINTTNLAGRRHLVYGS